jgi:long-chain acyl-CoA synthetase
VAEVNSGLASFETVKYWSPIDPLSVGSGLLTASLKVKRAKVAERWQDEVDAMYRKRR